MIRTSLLTLCLFASACGEVDVSPPAELDSDAAVVAENDGFMGCPTSIPGFALGMRAVGDKGLLGATLVAASNAPPLRYLNDWTLTLTRADGSTLADAVVTKARPFMPVHGHDGIVQPIVERLAEPGQVRVRSMNLNMRGPWEIQLTLSSPSVGEDYVVFHICVQE